jgi:hypothetical protein
MYSLIVVILFLGYGLVLTLGFLRVARELITTPFPRLLSDSDDEAHRDDDSLGSAILRQPHRSASCDAIDEGRQKGEQP